MAGPGCPGCWQCGVSARDTGVSLPLSVASCCSGWFWCDDCAAGSGRGLAEQNRVAALCETGGVNTPVLRLEMLVLQGLQRSGCRRYPPREATPVDPSLYGILRSKPGTGIGARCFREQDKHARLAHFSLCTMAAVNPCSVGLRAKASKGRSCVLWA